MKHTGQRRDVENTSSFAFPYDEAIRGYRTDGNAMILLIMFGSWVRRSLCQMLWMKRRASGTLNFENCASERALNSPESSSKIFVSNMNLVPQAIRNLSQLMLLAPVIRFNKTTL